jgi:hypothetical protein
MSHSPPEKGSRRRVAPSLDRVLFAVRRSGHQPQTVRVSREGEIEILFRVVGQGVEHVEQVSEEVEDWFAKRAK